MTGNCSAIILLLPNKRRARRNQDNLGFTGDLTSGSDVRIERLNRIQYGSAPRPDRMLNFAQWMTS
jgi:hypothetical protein